MKRSWIYLVNPFESATENSYRSMKKIGALTYDKICGKVPPPDYVPAPGEVRDVEEDNFFNELKSRLTPVWNNFNSKYTAWDGSHGDRKFQSTKLAEQLKLLSGIKIADWDLEIQRAYRKGTPEYLHLLPSYRTPFQRGSSQSRLSAVETLNLQVAANTSLSADLKADVSGFLADLKQYYTDNNNEGGGGFDSGSGLEMARVALCSELFGVLCQLTDHYRDNTDHVAYFFDLQEIRRHEQTVFNGTLKPREVVEVLKRKLKADKLIRLVNGGDTQLKFYLVEQDADDAGLKTVTVDARKELKVKPDQLGDPTHRILKVQNLDAQESHYTVELE